jgi:hypothetical protein
VKREDFIKITKDHIKIAKQIIENDGCENEKGLLTINCHNCPFSYVNNISSKLCKGVYNSMNLAKQFLELFDTEPKSLNFYERLSATLYSKQVVFKQDDGSYYNKNIHDIMTKSDVKEWLLAEVGELCKDE